MTRAARLNAFRCAWFVVSAAKLPSARKAVLKSCAALMSILIRGNSLKSLATDIDRNWMRMTNSHLANRYLQQHGDWRVKLIEKVFEWNMYPVMLTVWWGMLATYSILCMDSTVNYCAALMRKSTICLL